MGSLSKDGQRRRLRERYLKMWFSVIVIILRLFQVVRHGKCVSTFQEQNWYELCGSLKRKTAGAHVLHITSRRYHDGNSKEMYQNLKRTCRACRAIVLWRSRSRRRRPCFIFIFSLSMLCRTKIVSILEICNRHEILKNVWNDIYMSLISLYFRQFLDATSVHILISVKFP